MAKRRPAHTTQQLERKLGYDINHDISGFESAAYYIDLRPVPQDKHSRVQRELDEQTRCEFPVSDDGDILFENTKPSFQSEVVDYDGNTTTLKRTNHSRMYPFAASIDYNFRLRFSFLLTSVEASRALSAPKLIYNPTSDLGPIFSSLPAEIRQKIFYSVIPSGIWERQEHGVCLPNLAESLGDQSGFFFPLCQLPLLRTCKQIRFESLAFAYQKTMFRLDDIDEAIQVLIAAGQVGRQNITALEFSWSSRSDLERQASNAPADREFVPALVTLHAEECSILLEQCRNLKHLRLQFDEDLVDAFLPEVYEANEGLRRLQHIRGLQKLDIIDAAGEPLKRTQFVQWLRELTSAPG
ncbi:hypothetical protein LTS08_008882 [Lithohypha guttulata]|uniref:uncharacterized protein n=1 Tax=Lithohypha guttulata TaxID=1690604 RepID=UPI002DE081CE|nr:hypothetical protein LTS08_008882 [Lithohypha guttulata]